MNNITPNIRKALDGRTQRWLALKIGMPEADMSNKLNGRLDFTDKEIKAIEAALKIKFTLTPLK